jgi:glycosyltransferase involved in cell wall biosynthesis
MTPRISVLMPVFNGARYLKEAVDSILMQTFPDFEFIIIDDGSTDDTPSILQFIQDPRVIVYRNNENLGLAKSLNLGLQYASSELIARQDADDVSISTRLEKQMLFMDAHPRIGVLGCLTKWIDSQGNTIQDWHQPLENPEIQQTLLRYCCIIHGSTMFRKKAAIECGSYNPDMRTGQDYDLWLRMSESWDFACLSDILYYHRRHNQMASVQSHEEQSLNAKQALTQAIQRRLSYSSLLIGLHRAEMPENLISLDRKALAKRFTWWSAGSREISRWIAFKFLLISFLFDPLCSELWSYIQEIFFRKFNNLIKKLRNH